MPKQNISENESVFQKDVETAAMVIILSTAEKGLGRCMIGIFSSECHFEILDFPKNIKPQLVLAPGKPTDEIITEPVKNGNTDYYIDRNGVRHVQKRNLEKISLIFIYFYCPLNTD